MAWCLLALCSLRGLVGLLTAAFVLDFATCARLSARSPLVGELFLVRVVFYPMLGWLAWALHWRAASRSPLVQPRGALAAALLARDRPERQERHVRVMNVARARRDAAGWTLFLLGSLLSFLSGASALGGAESPGLDVAVVFLTGAETLLVLELVRVLTEETGETLPHLHLHPLFFELDLQSHTCSVCEELMEKPLYAGFRCRVCDFDLCVRCHRTSGRADALGHACRALRRTGKPVTTWTYLGRILALALPEWPLVLTAGVSLCVAQGMAVVVPSVVGTAFDSVLDPDGEDRFRDALALYACVCAVEAVAEGVKSLAQDLVMRDLEAAAKLQLFRSVIRMDVAFFDAMHTGQLTSRLAEDTDEMIEPLEALMDDLVANLLLLGGAGAMAFRTSWRLALLSTTVVAPITYSYRSYAAWAQELYKHIYCSLGEANAVATQAIANVRTVRAFSTEDWELRRYEDNVRNVLRHGRRNAFAEAGVASFSSALNLGTAVLVLWYGGQLVRQGRDGLTVGGLVSFQLYWTMMNGAFLELGEVFSGLVKCTSAAERVFSLLEATPVSGAEVGSPLETECLAGHLEIQSVEFRYLTRPDYPVLRSVSLSMAPASTTAIVGRSGCGKSTLVHLLMRLYEPTSGRIVLDGRDLHDLSSSSLRQICGFVAQETQLFAGSVAENLVYGLQRPCTSAELVAACRAAGAHDFVAGLEEQYDTRLGEKGGRLSGGQRQRLAVARCFLRKPQLLFLDEPTSALDAESERVVQRSIGRMVQELRSTVVIAAHRLTTVTAADQIAVLHEGRVAELGRHEELLAAGGLYSELVCAGFESDGEEEEQSE
jgi:ATP-binding cassette subfamily B protein